EMIGSKLIMAPHRGQQPTYTTIILYTDRGQQAVSFDGGILMAMHGHARNRRQPDSIAIFISPREPSATPPRRRRRGRGHDDTRTRPRLGPPAHRANVRGRGTADRTFLPT